MCEMQAELYLWCFTYIVFHEDVMVVNATAVHL